MWVEWGQVGQRYHPGVGLKAPGAAFPMLVLKNASPMSHLERKRSGAKSTWSKLQNVPH